MAASDSRRVFIGGNWKMASSTATISAVAEAINGMGSLPPNADVMIAPPMLHISALKAALKVPVIVGAQHTAVQSGFGAFTGEHSTDMLKDFGITWTLVGHSERRLVFGESNEVCAAKAHAALEAGMTVVFCVGEELAQREDGSTMEVVGAQLAALLQGLPAGSWERLLIAYEPVWAIGTGKTASPQQAQDTHADIRAWLGTNAGAEVASGTRIAYGGSVKPANCNELMAQPDVDGFLVGGASLKADFVQIIESAALKGQ